MSDQRTEATTDNAATFAEIRSSLETIRGERISEAEVDDLREIAKTIDRLRAGQNGKKA